MLALFEVVEVDEAEDEDEEDEEDEDVQSWTRLDEVSRGCIDGFGLGFRAGGGGRPDSCMEARFMFSLKDGLAGSRSYAGSDLGPDDDDEEPKTTGRGRRGEWAWRPCWRPK